MKRLLCAFVVMLILGSIANAGEGDQKGGSQVSVSPSSGAHSWSRYAGWGMVALFAGGGLGGYLRRRPTGFFVVALWYYAAYQAYASMRHGITPLPPLLAIALSFPLGFLAKVANDEAVRQGTKREKPYTFTSASSLSFSFNLITMALIVSLLCGWRAWDIVPGIRDCPFSRKMVLGTLLLTGLPFIMWIDTLAQGGIRLLKTLPTMIGIFLRCRRGRQLLAMVVFCIALWHWPFAKDLSPLRWHMTISLVLVVGLLWLQPPYVLMLGASSEATGKTLSRLSNAAFPFRIVALLDTQRTGHYRSSFSWITDDLRTVNEHDWRTLVDRLVDVLPVIVLDARTDRPVVVQEAESLLHRPERLRRSTFVITEDGKAPALTMNGVHPAFAGLRIVRSEQIEALMTFGKVASVSPDAPS